MGRFHTVGIPDDQWSRWQKLTGMQNPAPLIREGAAQLLEERERQNEQASFTTVPDGRIDAIKVRLPEGYDAGKLIIAADPWRCSRHECLAPSPQEPAGTQMVIYRQGGPFGGLRGTEHPKCRQQTVYDETGVWLE